MKDITLRQILERARNRADNGVFSVKQSGYGDSGNSWIELRFWGHGNVHYSYSPWSLALSHAHDFDANIPEELLAVAHFISSDKHDPAAQFIAMRHIVGAHVANALVTLWSPWVLKALDFDLEEAK